MIGDHPSMSPPRLQKLPGGQAKHISMWTTCWNDVTLIYWPTDLLDHVVAGKAADDIHSLLVQPQALLTRFSNPGAISFQSVTSARQPGHPDS